MDKNLHKYSKDELIEEILKLRDEKEKLTKDVENLKGKTNTLKDKVEDLKGKTDTLKDKIKDLKGQLNLNSHNSSKPPSTSGLGKKTQICNSRQKSNKPRGGQIDHIGNTLHQYKKSHFTKILEIHSCSHCGSCLDKTKMENEVKRQVVDIPKPLFEVTEYIGGEKKCACCNHITKSSFPVGVEQPIQYGPNIKASSVYMYNYIMPSYQRLQEYWKEVHELNISQTSLMNFNTKGYDVLEDFEEKVKKTLIQSKVLHVDETGVRISGKTQRIHTSSSKTHTLYVPHEKRGGEAIEAIGILCNYTNSLVSDHWKSYTFFALVFHCFCNAHHLRELKWVEENEGKEWASEMIKLLLYGKSLRDEAVDKGETYLAKNVLDEMNERYKSVLLKGKTEYVKVERQTGKRGRIKQEKGLNLLFRLEECEQGTLQFLYNFEIPFDNNLAERDLRMVKLKTKISGCFRSFQGAEWFCRIRSYISTMRKQKGNIYSSLLSLFHGDILLPEF